MKAIAYSALIGLLLVGCGAGSPPTPSPSPTPQPTATAVPTSPPTATPLAKPTFTAGDQRIQTFILDGFAQVSGLLGDIGSAAGLPDMVQAYRDLNSLASSQQLTALALLPSSCTKPALDIWVDAMGLMEAMSRSYLDAVESGDFSNFDSDAGYAAGQRARQATDTLNGSPCN